MGFIATNSGGNFKQVPPGAYIGRCYSLIDLGTQVSEKFGTSAHKLRISWELFGDDDEGQPLTIERDGKSVPLTVSNEYTVSLNEKANLRKHLVAWRGRDFTADELKAFDISKLLGAYCMVNVTTSEGANGKTYSNVAGLSPLPKALAANKPTGVHQLVTFDIDAPDMAVFDALPEWLQEKIRAAAEWGKAPAKSTAAAGDMDDDGDVPF